MSAKKSSSISTFRLTASINVCMIGVARRAAVALILQKSLDFKKQEWQGRFSFHSLNTTRRPRFDPVHNAETDKNNNALISECGNSTSVIIFNGPNRTE